MPVSHNPAGFTGTVDEVAWAKLMGVVATRFRVASSSDWALSVSGSVNRTVNIAAGSAMACGVYDTTTAQDSVAFAANTGGSSRYDALVATFVWGSDTVTFAAIQGTTSPPAVNTTTTVDNTKINRIPGVQYDAVLAIVQVRAGVGLFTSGDLNDLRPYGGLSGALLVPQTSYYTMIDATPGLLVITQDQFRRLRYTAAGTWMVGGYVGTVKTGVPQMTLAYAAAPVANNVSTAIGTWPTVTDNSLGWFSYVSSSQIQCNQTGYITIEATAESDVAYPGYSYISVTNPVGANPTLENQSHRSSSAYTGSGTLKQRVCTPGPVLVNAGDLIAMNVMQINTNASTVNYSLWLSAAYVPL